MINRRVLAAALVLGLTVLARPAEAKKAKKPMADEFSGTLISMSVSEATGTRVSIWVESYTADDVAEGLITKLEQQGQKGLLDAVEDMRAGTIRIGTSNGYPIAVARQRVHPDGSRTVVLATDRPFMGIPATAGMKIEDFPFGLVELKLAADGTGEGTLVGAAQLSFDAATKNLSVKSYATQPGRLSNVTTAKPKP